MMWRSIPAWTSILFVFACAGSAAGADMRLHVDYEDGILALDLRAAPVDEVIHTIADRVGFRIGGRELDDDADPVTLRYTGPVREGLRRVLREFNYALWYEKDPPVGGETGAVDQISRVYIAKVFLLGKIGARQYPEVPATPLSGTGAEMASAPAAADPGTAPETASPTPRARRTHAATVSRLLRSRAAVQVAPSWSVSPATEGVDAPAAPREYGTDASAPVEAANGDAPPGPGNADLQEQLRLATQRARQDVQALAESLRQVDGTLNQGLRAP